MSHSSYSVFDFNKTNLWGQFICLLSYYQLMIWGLLK